MNKFNQTNPAWLDPTLHSARGTGIYLIPDPQSPVQPAARKEYVENLTYAEAIARGWRTLAMKWVPHSVADSQTLRASACQPLPCVDDCVEIGCVCLDGRCQAWGRRSVRGWGLIAVFVLLLIVLAAGALTAAKYLTLGPGWFDPSAQYTADQWRSFATAAGAGLAFATALVGTLLSMATTRLIESAKADAAEKLEALRHSNATEIEGLRKAHGAELAEFNASQARELQELRDRNAAALEDFRLDFAARLEAMRAENARALEQFKTAMGRLLPAFESIRTAAVFYYYALQQLESGAYDAALLAQAEAKAYEAAGYAAGLDETTRDMWNAVWQRARNIKREAARENLVDETATPREELAGKRKLFWRTRAPILGGHVNLLTDHLKAEVEKVIGPMP
jgi:hypothetical protein